MSEQQRLPDGNRIALPIPAAPERGSEECSADAALPVTSLYLLSITMVLAASADFLFWRQPVGWSVSLFGILLAGALPIYGRLRRNRICVRTIAGPLCVVGASLIICLCHSSALGVLLGVAGISGVVVGQKNGRLLSAVQWFVGLAEFWIFACIEALTDMAGIVRFYRGRRSGLKGKIAVWGASFAMASVFLALFAMANPVILDGLCRAGRFFGRIGQYFDIGMIWRTGHFVVFLVLAWAVLGYRGGFVGDDFDVREPPTVPVGFTDASLVLFNIVFAVQTLLDVGYLFSGVELPANYTYAQYAHRGFYPLWAASMLAAAFMLLFWSENTKKFPQTKLRSALLYIWIAQNFLLLFSAIYRMKLYVCVYSLTRLRVAAFAGMALVIVGLAGITLRILRRRSITWLINLNGCSILAVMLILAAVNVSALVAMFNVRHCRESGGGGVSLDVRYLEKLGADALPALLRFKMENPQSGKIPEVNRAIAGLRAEFDSQIGNWRGWTLSTCRIKNLLDKFPEGERLAQEKSDFNRIYVPSGSKGAAGRRLYYSNIRR